ncbi:hypothetical protein TSAR_016274 [Trichomalopsis sarcophagae]|uniref:Uncharacterized protein n=1 Tax=Trichomalopsis sarcophagae TaxID=543379 RepID=A0A232F582_9HYME|nr:hypothetical protein TSAR_016274 [Trichomalopsis sarcophagae]
MPDTDSDETNYECGMNRNRMENRRVLSDNDVSDRENRSPSMIVSDLEHSDTILSDNDVSDR